MTDRLALDTNAVVRLFRAAGAEEPPALASRTVVLPLPVVGELFAGAYASAMHEQNLEITESFVEQHDVISPDEETARLYGRLRAKFRMSPGLTVAKLNDLWIAAICIQHGIPLLTNDRGFSSIAGLTVVTF